MRRGCLSLRVRRIYGFRLLIFLLVIAGLILSGCSQQIASKMSFPSLESSSLRSFPVSIGYDVDNVGIIDNSQHTIYLVKLWFKNIGSERVAFIVANLVVIDESGKVYRPIYKYCLASPSCLGLKGSNIKFGCPLSPIELYPKENNTVVYVFESLPHKGEIYFEIYDINDIGLTKKLEAVKLNLVI